MYILWRFMTQPCHLRLPRSPVWAPLEAPRTPHGPKETGRKTGGKTTILLLSFYLLANEAPGGFKAEIALWISTCKNSPKPIITKSLQRPG